MMVDMNVEGTEEDVSEEKGCQKLWVPQLKTIGDIPGVLFHKLNVILSLILISNNVFFFRDKSTAFFGVGELRCLFHSFNCLLLQILIISVILRFMHIVCSRQT